MSYTKQNFASGDILEAADLNAMDDQIALNELTVFTATTTCGTTYGHLNDTVTLTCSATYAQIAAVWPNCVLHVDSNYYAYPNYKTSTAYWFNDFYEGYRRRYIVTSSGWTINMAAEYMESDLGTVLVIGDSMCAGNSSNTRTWVDWLKMDKDLWWVQNTNVTNAAVYGAAFGAYSVGGVTSLLAQLNANSSVISSGKPTVLVCSCLNDVLAAEAGNVTYKGIVDAAKTLFDRIRTINANARIVYLSYGSGLITNASDYETAFASRCIPVDLAISALCMTEGIQVISLTSGSGYNKTFVQADYAHPTDAGMDKIGKAMRIKLLDRTTTLHPDSNVILDFGNGTNPYKYDLPFIRYLYNQHGIDVKLRLYAVSGYWCIGTIAYVSDPGSQSDIAMWYSMAPTSSTLSSSQTMDRYCTKMVLSNGVTTTTCVKIHTV